MYWVYILKSLKYGKYYVGSTSNLEKRLSRHNKGGSKWTSKYKPWLIVYKEYYSNKTEALKRERQIKKYKGGNKFKQLLSRDGGVVNRNSL